MPAFGGGDRARTHPGPRRGRDAERARREGGKQRPGDIVQLARRYDNARIITKVTGGRSNDQVLEFRSGSLQDGQCAVQVVPRSVASKAAEGETGELSGADGLCGSACRVLPYLSRPAYQDVQDAVDIDNLDQLGVA